MKDDMAEALRELVACKDLKERIIEMGCPDTPDSPELSALNAEYKLRQPRAWAAARSVLSKQEPSDENRNSVKMDVTHELRLTLLALQDCVDSLSHYESKFNHGVRSPAADRARAILDDPEIQEFLKFRL